MRILVLGGDGYLGWPTALHLSRRGHHVGVVDSFVRRSWDHELGADPVLHDHRQVLRHVQVGGERLARRLRAPEEVRLVHSGAIRSGSSAASRGSC